MPGLEDEIGDIVRKARTGLGLELGEVAQRTGLTERNLKSLEVYTFTPDERQTRALAAVLHLRPDPLWEIAQDAWSAPDVGWAIGTGDGALSIDCLTNDYPEHCYVLTASDGKTVIVDPGDEAERVIATATRDGRKPVAILVTHRHQDHTGALVPVQRSTGATVFIHHADAEGAAGVPDSHVRAISQDGPLDIAGFSVRAAHTPGHTEGSATYVVTSGGAVAAFCGDTLFAGSAGGARAGYDVLLSSLRETLARLPDQTVFYPGHGPATTLQHERARNPFL